LWIYAPQKANRWILTSNGNILAEKQTDQMQKKISFDIAKIKEYEEIKVSVFEDDKFLCETIYNQKLESTYDKESLTISTFTPKEAYMVDWDFGSIVFFQNYRGSENEDGHRFSVELAEHGDRLDPGTYEVLIMAYDEEDNELYPEKEKLEINVQY